MVVFCRSTVSEPTFHVAGFFASLVWAAAAAAAVAVVEGGGGGGSVGGGEGLR